MKLAEALILRADYRKRIAQLQQRLATCVRVQEGDSPPENPEELLSEFERIMVELETLIKRINRTNAHTSFREGVSLSDALAEREIILARRTLHQGVVEQAALSVDRYSRSEIKYVRIVDVVSIQKAIDDMSAAYRLLDTRIQEVNWLTDLLD